MDPGKVMIPHVERSPHDTPTVEGEHRQRRVRGILAIKA